MLVKPQALLDTGKSVFTEEIGEEPLKSVLKNDTPTRASSILTPSRSGHAKKTSMIQSATDIILQPAPAPPVNRKATLEGHSGSAACQKKTRLESVKVDVGNSFSSSNIAREKRNR